MILTANHLSQSRRDFGDLFMTYFVDEHSIVRKIWGKGDTILFIFAGASAEFALNKAVDWLYFTGKLPEDPIGRLFSTVCYAQEIVFPVLDHANRAIDKITSIHTAVEKSRQASIPDWAYRDVLYMLIHYSIASFEVLERKLTLKEKEEVYDVFYRVGIRMKLKDLPMNYTQWRDDYSLHLQNDLLRSRYSVDLFRQYKKHLGNFRYWLLLQTQKMIVPVIVRKMLGYKKFSWLQIVLPFYKFSRLLKLDTSIRSLLLPAKYRATVKALDK